MRGFIKKAGAVLLAVVLLACMGVGVGMGQIPMITGIIICALLLIFFTAWLLHMRDNLPVKAQLPPPESMTLSAEEKQRLLAKAYTQVQSPLALPGHVQSIQIPSNLLVPFRVNMMYYCWRTQDHLHLFPRWDSIEASLRLLEFLELDIRYEEIHFHVQNIPLKDIICYTRETVCREIPSYATLHYRNPLGETVGLLLSQCAWPALKALVPHLDQAVIRSRRYPQSARQISDITSKLQQLKALHMQSLIDEEEYTAKKRELLTTL